LKLLMLSYFNKQHCHMQNWGGTWGGLKLNISRSKFTFLLMTLCFLLEPVDVRLVGGAGHCAGTLEAKHLGEWRPLCASHDSWTLKEAAVFYSVRLLNGSSLCSGRLEVKSNQSWSSVCEADFDQQDAEVVCRELGCGPPSVLQGALYGEVEAPVWSKEFQCGGHESALLDCRSSGSARNSCSPGKAVGLTCSESDFRLVGGASRCAGILEVQNRKEWRPVDSSDWSLKEAAVVCIHLDCGPAVSVKKRHNFSWRSRWKINSDCVQPGAPLRDCTTSADTDQILNITCSENRTGSGKCSWTHLRNSTNIYTSLNYKYQGLTKVIINKISRKLTRILQSRKECVQKRV
uniref:SRCR domain-containing protein n=1 Tax=Oreochromis niloticus TaxID=8128 RepID=A0A669E875_ORENI